MKDRLARLRTRSQRGYSLIELMVVVTIVGILAAIAIPSFTNYLRKSKTSEATSFLVVIKQRQAAYFAEMGQFCDVATPNPATEPSDGDSEPWAASANWLMLGAAPDTPSVLFQYDSIADEPGNLPSTRGFSDDRGYDGTDFWFISTARTDLDGDGTSVTFESYSDHARIHISDSKGWE